MPIIFDDKPRKKDPLRHKYDLENMPTDEGEAASSEHENPREKHGLFILHEPRAEEANIE